MTVSPPPPPDGRSGGDAGRFESAYTRGVTDALAAAMTLLSSVRALLGRPDDDPVERLGLSDPSRSPSPFDRTNSMVLPDALGGATDATWIAAFALALASDHAPCPDDVDEILRMSGNDIVTLGLATTRLQSETPDSLARRTALRLLHDAHDVAGGGTEHAEGRE